MGRSVSYPSGAVVAFDVIEYEDDVDEFEAQYIFDDVLEDFDREVARLFPKTWPDNKWIGREDHALRANSFAYFGVSEYCGLIAYWIAPRGDCEKEGLQAHWLQSVADKFQSHFGTYTRVGVFSNGEAVYRKKEAKHA